MAIIQLAQYFNLLDPLLWCLVKPELTINRFIES